MAPFLADHLPSPGEITDLPEDDLGIRFLRLIVEHGQGHLLNRHDIGLAGSWTDLGEGSDEPTFLQAVVEAWDWLAVNRLVARIPGDPGERGYVTRRGHRVLSAPDPLALLKAEERLGLELHPRIERRVRRQFLLGEHELAALAALREVEIRVRDLAQLSSGDVGVKLMRKAFGPGGPLADPEMEAGEQEATAHLFVGAIGVFKNPSSHREVHYDDSAYAAEVVLLADLLLRMLDQVETRITDTEGA